MRYRFEFGLILTVIAFALAIGLYMDRATPSVTDIERSLRSYVQQLRSSRSLSGGSLRLEMQADVIGPTISHLDITDERSFIDYWAVDAVMQVEELGIMPKSIPIRLRVAQRDGAWTVLDAEDLSRHVALRQ